MTDLVKRHRIAVDWDGTLIEDNTWPNMGDWLPGAVDALRALAETYDEVVIWTLRTATFEIDEVTPRLPWDQVDQINRMLWDADLPLNIHVWTEPYKPPAEFYVDNRAVRFEGDWGRTLVELGYIREREHYANHKEERMEEDGFYELLVMAPPATDESPGEKAMRQFETGANRNNDADEFDYEGFLSPLALWAYADYMHRNRFQADGTVRDSDNWQKGIPVRSYRKSLVRHLMDVWLNERGFTHLGREDTVTALCAIIFNAQGMLHELLKADLEESRAA